MSISHIILPHHTNKKGKLFISGFYEALQESTILNNNIKAIISLRDNPFYEVEHPNVDIYNITLPDEPSQNIHLYFQSTRAFIKKYIDNGKNVLVHCTAGVSRSPTIVIFFIMKEYGMSYEDAFSTVEKCRECISPNEGFISQLNNFKLK